MTTPDAEILSRRTAEGVVKVTFTTFLSGAVIGLERCSDSAIAVEALAEPTLSCRKVSPLPVEGVRMVEDGMVLQHFGSETKQQAQAPSVSNQIAVER
jgi:hypothetical protein